MRYQLKTPWRNGTTHVEFEPIEFIAKLAALVPPPRAHLTPSGRGKRLPSNATQDTPPEPADPRTPDKRRRSMTWAQRLKRVFNIDVTTCVNCGGAARIVASVEDPTAIRAILAHFDKHGVLEHAHYRPRLRPRNRTIGHAHPNCENQYRARSGDDPAGPRSARCRESVRNGRKPWRGRSLRSVNC